MISARLKNACQKSFNDIRATVRLFDENNAALPADAITINLGNIGPQTAKEFKYGFQLQPGIGIRLDSLADKTGAIVRTHTSIARPRKAR